MARNGNGLATLLLGLGALWLLSKGGKAAPEAPPAWSGVIFPSTSPIVNLYVEGTGGIERPAAEERLIIKSINGTKYHTGYTKEEMAWRRAQPATTIRRGGGTSGR